jgi:hypothetical protein
MTSSCEGKRQAKVHTWWTATAFPYMRREAAVHGHGWGGDVLGVEDDQAGAATRVVVDQPEEPAAVLRMGAGGIGNEEELAGVAVRPEVMGLACAGHQVVLEHPRVVIGGKVPAEGDRVAVLVAGPEPCLVDPT